MSVTVDLWLWRLDRQTPAGCLSEDEEARAGRYVHARDRMAFRAARAGLRRVLGLVTDRDPACLTFRQDAAGKPFLPGGPSFNLSHSGDWALLGVTPAHPLGVDLEAHRPVETAVARRFFSPAEQAALRRLPITDWPTGFFRLWTRKEAVVKALGTGLSHPLDSFDVTLTEIAALNRMEGGDPRDWTLADLPLGPRMAGAVAMIGAGAPVELRLREGAMPLPD